MGVAEAGTRLGREEITRDKKQVTGSVMSNETTTHTASQGRIKKAWDPYATGCCEPPPPEDNFATNVHIQLTALSTTYEFFQYCILSFAIFHFSSISGPLAGEGPSHI